MYILWGDRLKVNTKVVEDDFKSYYTYINFKKTIKNNIYTSDSISTISKFHTINNIEIPKRLINVIESNKEFQDECFYKYADMKCYDIRNRDYAVVMCDGEYYDNLDNHMRSHSDLISSFYDYNKDGIRENGSDDFEKLLVGHIVDDVFFIERDTLKCDLMKNVNIIVEKYNPRMVYLFTNYEDNPQMELLFKKNS